MHILGSDSAFRRFAVRQPMLSRDEERDLARLAHSGDKEALSRLVVSHLRLVIKIAERYQSAGLTMPDLVQEGCVGLLQALQRFNPDRDARLSTYAMWWIKAAIQDHVMRSWSLVRIGTSAAQKSLFFNLRRLRSALNETGESMSDAAVAHIARVLSVPEKEVRSMEQRLAGPDGSLSNRNGADDSGDAECDGGAMSTPHTDLANPEESLIWRDERRRRRGAAAAALAALSHRELLIIRRRYLSDVSQTLESLGRELGISKERVRQIEARAMDKMRALAVPQVTGRAAI